LCTEEYDLIYTKKLSKVLEENDSETEHSGILKKLLNGMDEINRWRDDVNNKVNEIIEANNDSVDLTENFVERVDELNERVKVFENDENYTKLIGSTSALFVEILNSIKNLDPNLKLPTLDDLLSEKNKSTKMNF
jgi:uncharacterized coiled-coil DUF342 family protein